jgi:hypothetical protein
MEFRYIFWEAESRFFNNIYPNIRTFCGRAVRKHLTVCILLLTSLHKRMLCLFLWNISWLERQVVTLEAVQMDFWPSIIGLRMYHTSFVLYKWLIICPRPLNTSTCGATSVNVCFISVLFWQRPERHFITHDYIPSGHSWTIACIISRCIIVAGRKRNHSHSKWKHGNLAVGGSSRNAGSTWRVRRRLIRFKYYLKLIVFFVVNPNYLNCKLILHIRLFLKDCLGFLMFWTFYRIVNFYYSLVSNLILFSPVWELRFSWPLTMKITSLSHIAVYTLLISTSTRSAASQKTANIFALLWKVYC